MSASTKKDQLDPRVLDVVQAALERWGVSARQLTRLAAEVVRVDATDGRRFVLRFRPRAGRTFGNIPLELAWMEALRCETDVEPPEPVLGLDGEVVQEVEAGLFDCVLFHWIPGTELANRLTLENVKRLGVLSAKLHEHALTYRPPANIEVRTLHELIGRGEREVLFNYEHPEFLPLSRRAVFQEVAERFQKIVDARYADPAGRRVIHADLHHENVKIHRGKLRPLDFYEVIWGYPIQDVALTCFDLRYYTPSQPHGYATLREAFRQGYTSRLPWPETHPGEIDVLVAGRRLRQANWVLAHETAQFATPGQSVPDPAAIVRYFERLEAEFREVIGD